jgi:hypothetical protein
MVLEEKRTDQTSMNLSEWRAIVDDLNNTIEKRRNEECARNSLMQCGLHCSELPEMIASNGSFKTKYD